MISLYHHDMNLEDVRSAQKSACDEEKRGKEPRLVNTLKHILFLVEVPSDQLDDTLQKAA